MSSKDLYRQRALECYSFADSFSDPDQREAMRLLAIFWLDLEQVSEKVYETGQGDRGQRRSTAA